MESELFASVIFDPLTLRNRAVRSAAFESMCPDDAPSQMLLDYHRSVATGGVGMTTVAYATATQSGLSFDRQLRLRPEIISGLRKVAGVTHTGGAATSIQIGHCGDMSHKKICGTTSILVSTGLNLYSSILMRGMKREESPEMARAYGRAVHLAREAGSDAVKVHAGHGCLINQFLSPYTNHQRNEYGGSLENRIRFMEMVTNEVMTTVRSDMAISVRINICDGFEGGMKADETLQVVKCLLALGAHALVLSGGFVSKAPMYVTREAMPIRSMAYYMDCWQLKYGVRISRKRMIPTVPFRGAYFLEDVLEFRVVPPEALSIYVGGLMFCEETDEILDVGFDTVQMAHALLNEPEFVNRMRREEQAHCSYGRSNHCIGHMYTTEMACYQHPKEGLLPYLQRKTEKLEKQWMGRSGQPSPVPVVAWGRK